MDAHPGIRTAYGFFAGTGHGSVALFLDQRRPAVSGRNQAAKE
jgi:hypothetical protein